MVMNYHGDDSVISALKKRGIVSPVTYNRGMDMRATITTGRLNAHNRIPVELVFNKAEDIDGNTMIPAGTKMAGSVVRYKMPVYDSVISDQMDQDTKRTFLETFKNILAEISFPVKRMAIGDTFKFVAPLNFALGDLTIKLSFSTVYTLRSYDATIANFDIDMTYTLNKDDSAMVASGGGSGSGVMVLDLKNDYPLKFTSAYRIELAANKNGVFITSNISGNSDSENSIYPVKKPQ